MGRKSRRAAAPEEERTAAEYYRLNTKAIDDLVNADASNSPPVSKEELRKYRSGPRISLKEWVKAALIKAWFAGAACFFFFWGLGMAVPSQENQLIILAVGLGMITDLLVNPIFRYYEKTPGASARWMMVRRKGVAGMALNLLYAGVLLACVVATYQGLNTALAAFSGARESVPLGVEPIGFGLLTCGWDFLFLGIRKTARHVLEDAKKQQR